MSSKRIDEREISAILVRCKQGETEALASLYKKVAPLLNHFAIGIVHSEALSSEVLQESFIQIWTHADCFNPNKGKPLSWMRAIVKNKAIDKLRAERKHEAQWFDNNDEIINEIPSIKEHEPDVLLANRQQQAILKSQFQRLPRNQSESLTLAYFYDFTRNDLSINLDANINTIKSWLRRGIASMKSNDELNFTNL